MPALSSKPQSSTCISTLLQRRPPFVGSAGQRAGAAGLPASLLWDSIFAPGSFGKTFGPERATYQSQIVSVKDPKMNLDPMCYRR